MQVRCGFVAPKYFHFRRRHFAAIALTFPCSMTFPASASTTPAPSSLSFLAFLRRCVATILLHVHPFLGRAVDATGARRGQSGGSGGRGSCRSCHCERWSSDSCRTESQCPRPRPFSPRRDNGFALCGSPARKSPS